MYLTLACNSAFVNKTNPENHLLPIVTFISKVHTEKHAFCRIWKKENLINPCQGQRYEYQFRRKKQMLLPNCPNNIIVLYEWKQPSLQRWFLSRSKLRNRKFSVLKESPKSPEKFSIAESEPKSKRSLNKAQRIQSQVGKIKSVYEKKKQTISQKKKKKKNIKTILKQTKSFKMTQNYKSSQNKM